MCTSWNSIQIAERYVDYYKPTGKCALAGTDTAVAVWTDKL